MTTTYVLDGNRIRTLDDFWQVIMDAFDGPGRQYFGRNLSAFADCLSGGPGYPDADGFIVEWRDHSVSREHLGYGAARPASARGRLGPTVFDQLVEVFESRAPGVLRLK